VICLLDLVRVFALRGLDLVWRNHHASLGHDLASKYPECDVVWPSATSGAMKPVEQPVEVQVAGSKSDVDYSLFEFLTIHKHVWALWVVVCILSTF
jgi:hypothetical protein